MRVGVLALALVESVLVVLSGDESVNIDVAGGVRSVTVCYRHVRDLRVLLEDGVMR